MLGEGDERISALPLVDLLRPVAPLVEHLLIETEPKEKLYSTLKKAHKMIVSRSTEPVTVEMWCDGTYLGHAPNLDEWPPLGDLTERAEAWPPREVKMNVAFSLELEAVEAPSCLLAIVDPGTDFVALPMDGSVLDARLVDIASYVVLRDDPSEGRERRELDGAMTEQLRRTAVAGVACNEEADCTADGMLARIRMLKEVRNGKYKVPELQTIHAVDAKLRDAIDATAPFVVLYLKRRGRPYHRRDVVRARGRQARRRWSPMSY